MPACAVEAYFPVPFQILLGVTDVVFPLLAEVHAVNDSVGGVVAEVRVQEVD